MPLRWNGGVLALTGGEPLLLENFGDYYARARTLSPRDPRSLGFYGRELVWRCLTLELWLRLFPDGARPAAPPAAA